jgi:hypothetical protein
VLGACWTGNFGCNFGEKPKYEESGTEGRNHAEGRKHEEGKKGAEGWKMHRMEIAHKQKDKASEREKEVQRMTMRLSRNRRTT